jgi:hypothetical protein
MHDGAPPPATDVPTAPDAGARRRALAETASAAIATADGSSTTGWAPSPQCR